MALFRVSMATISKEKEVGSCASACLTHHCGAHPRLVSPTLSTESAIVHSESARC